jgi:hypothetical protein
MQLFRIRLHRNNGFREEIHLGFPTEQEAIDWCYTNTRLAVAYEGRPHYSFLGTL